MIIEIKELSKEQKDALAKSGLLLGGLGAMLLEAGRNGILDKDAINAIRDTMNGLDDIFDEMSEENQDIFEFLQDGPASNLTKV